MNLCHGLDDNILHGIIHVHIVVVVYCYKVKYLSFATIMDNM